MKVIDTETNAATRKVSRDDMNQIKKQSKKSSHTEEIRLKKNSAKPPAQPVKSGKKKRPDYENEILDEEDEEEYESRMERFTTMLAVAGAVLIGCIIIFLVGRAIGIFRFPSSGQENGTQMIAAAGMTEEAALRALNALGLDLDVSVVYEESGEVEEGLVIRASVEPGTVLSKKDAVTLTVSGTQGGVTVPDVYNKSLAEAVSELEAQGFKTERNEGYSETVAQGNVMSQTPEGGSKAERGSTVTITISQGPQNSKVAVPDVLGMLPDEAKATLEAAGLTVRNVEEVSDDDETMIGRVIRLSYSIGTEVEPGTAIDIYVSSGPSATYMYVENIESPAIEDPAYVEGSQCVIVLTTASGTEIYRTATTSFPLPVNLLNISEPTGTLTLIYTVTADAATVTDPNTGEVTTVPGTSEQRTINRPITFIRNDSGT